ncbi:hypothetical protein [Nannocystis sp.]|uniref:hypothetical protein n=1 Tax=Nannocystis sp. TaxID=1962667 RepID=UPI0024259CBC|nr:hypothetical protein [Nannocystis sp.]MBK7829199.1 hypothetical protein [Nannocystis sp.]MBK9751968.1 hypothetical protein [Nannocystis sp.]
MKDGHACQLGGADERHALVAEPGGGVATHSAGIQRLAADRVPREAEALRVWTRARAAALGRE